jgi:hypothetical protein
MTIDVKGTFVGTGQSASFSPRADLKAGSFNISGFGTFVATVRLERSFDQGANWLPITLAWAATATWTAPWDETQSLSEPGLLYRYNCTAYVSGTVNYYISQ